MIFSREKDDDRAYAIILWCTRSQLFAIVAVPNMTMLLSRTAIIIYYSVVPEQGIVDRCSIIIVVDNIGSCAI